MPACLSDADSQTTSNGEPAYCYRLKGLLDTASDQGVLSHLHGASRLEEKFPGIHLDLGLDLSNDDGVLGEIDIFGFHAGKVVAGEAKTWAGQSDESQVNRSRVGFQVIMSEPIPMSCPVCRRQNCTEGPSGLICVAGAPANLVVFCFRPEGFRLDLDSYLTKLTK